MARLIKDERGYSLMEVIVAIMILAIAILPMVAMFDAALRAAAVGGNYDRARAVAQEELEEVRALPFSGAPNSVMSIYPPGAQSQCTGSMAAGFGCRVQTTYVSVTSSEVRADPGARSMLEVRISVTWNGGSNSYTNAGLISKETRCASGC